MSPGNITDRRREELRTHVESAIAEGSLAPGERLPSLRDFSLRFALNPSLVRRTLMPLCEAGLLEFRHGAGMFVAERRAGVSKGRRRLTIYIPHRNHPTSYSAHVLLNAAKRAEENGAMEVLIREVPLCTPRLRPEDKLVMLIGGYDTYLHELPADCIGVGVELLDNYGGKLSNVFLDPLAAAESAVRYFLSKGVTKVTVFSLSPPTYALRGELFCHAFMKAGGEVSMIPDFQFNLNCLKDPGIGYLFPGDTFCDRVSREFRAATGTRLADRRIVLGMDGKHRFIDGFEPFPSLGIDWDQVGRIACDECLSRFSQPGSSARRILINPKLYESEDL